MAGCQIQLIIKYYSKFVVSNICHIEFIIYIGKPTIVNILGMISYQPSEPTRKNRPVRFISPHHRVSLQKSNLFVKLAKQMKIKMRMVRPEFATPRLYKPSALAIELNRSKELLLGRSRVYRVGVLYHDIFIISQLWLTYYP